ncbi:MerR family transcriptional regulator [Bacillus sp. DTU_2020_1000418_1_SI_GHA_SEK_038]|uniref:MerR family transcriptional regulator n=1 Tax=Bacillus sp. DTU_2020_1000418_1_SI_GHA_SEK_038 TaxID=3077585 RepID=UPI0028EDC85F|nr:MerR family transcriptional regulator [Bacillus sp. DTU_2020_1000418_1_SI_GHA_SEK_038]WNS74793.1 MerR family transcriptional regulator [Bacillus sp. DTU_2020_1000418_1_SI_GHA_SEK_038]
MNTSAVAKLLGVSPSTVQRWVRQLGLQMERNELGHYLFKEEDIQMLKHVQDQLNKGIILQNVTVSEGKPRKGSIKTTVNISDKSTEKLLEKVELLEQRLNGKADDVVTYQLLQHRREIEDLQGIIKNLTERIETLENKQSSLKKGLPPESLLIFDKEKPKEKLKRKNIITSLFGF